MPFHPWKGRYDPWRNTIALVFVHWLLSSPVSAQTPPATFRSGVDLIAIDVQVIDRSGGPAQGLRPDQFQVSIDGKTRKVVSATFVDATSSSTTVTDTTTAPPTTVVTETRREQPAASRIFILAFDAATFRPLDVHPAREAAREFVNQLQPNDLVGLFAFPYGPIVDVTTDRARLLEQLETVVGHKPPPLAPDAKNEPPSQFIDATLLAHPPPFIIPMAAMEEMEISQRMGALKGMFDALATSPRRKVVVLVSAGILLTDRGGGRPDVPGLDREIGQSAARANATIYTLYFDRFRMEQTSASQSGAPNQSGMLRDSTIPGAPLDRIAGTSGGTSFIVVQGGGEFAFDRVLKETSGYYLLGVEPAPIDRDGKPHELRVRVTGADVTVRGRSWVTLPRTMAERTAAIAAATGEGLSTRPTAPPKPLSAAARPLVDSYAANDGATIARLMSGTAAANLLRDVREGDPVWPDNLRRWRVFVLELALDGLRGAGFVREEATRLLAQTHVVTERTANDDAFVCAWLRVEAAAVQGLWQPGFGLPFVERAVQRCPADPRIALARAVLMEQQAATEPDVIPRVADAYLAVPPDPAATFEARLRAAYFLVRHEDAARAFDLLPQEIPPAIADGRDLRYAYFLVKGEILAARGDWTPAAAAYRAALEVVPGAQSARVALMTLSLSHGDPSEAIQLAEAVQSAGRDNVDPWWLYSRGDYRIFSELLTTLRGMAR